MTTRRWMIAVLVIAVVIELLTWVSRLPEDVWDWLLMFILVPCLVLPLLGMAVLSLLPSWLTRRLFNLAGGTCIVALGVAMTPFEAGDPRRFGFAFLLVGALSLGLTCGLAHLASTLREQVN
jgi:hypothetical protein